MIAFNAIEKRSILYPSDFLAGFGGGDVVVDGTRTYGGCPFELENHIRRLLDGAAEQYISTDLSAEQLEQAVMTEIGKYRSARNERSTRGELAIRFALAAEGVGPYERNSRLLINVQSFDAMIQGLATKYHLGCRLTSVQQKAIPATVMRPQIKSRGSSHWRRAELEAHAISPGSWALLSFEDGVISEGVGIGASGWNVHVVKDGNIFVPKESQAVNGVAKQFVIKLAEHEGLKKSEKSLYVDDLLNADEVFLTSTTIGIMPVKSLDGIELVHGSLWGEVTSRLARLFHQHYYFAPALF